MKYCHIFKYLRVDSCLKKVNNMNEITDDVIDRGLEWILSNINDFFPFINNEPWDIKKGQRITELATLVLCLNHFNYKHNNLPLIINKIVEIYKNPRFRDRVLRSPDEFVLHCDLYGILKKLGIEDSEQRFVLKKALNSGIPNHIERQPHRILDVSLALEISELDSDWPDLNSKNIFKGTLLDQTINPIYLRESSLYAMTHIIMFLWGFGTRKPDSFFEKDKQKLATLLPSLLLCQVFDKHWDLVSELLICWDCIRLERTYAYDISWTTLLKQRLDSGAMPGPEEDIERRSFKPISEKEKRHLKTSFSHVYHTTLTTMMAATLRKYQTNNIPKNIPKKIESKKITTKILDSLLLNFEFCNSDINEMVENESWEPIRLSYDLLSIWIISQIIDINGEFDKIIKKIENLYSFHITDGSLNNHGLLSCMLSDLILTTYGIKVKDFHKATDIIVNISPEVSKSDPNIFIGKLIASQINLCEEPYSSLEENISVFLYNQDLTKLESKYLNFIAQCESYCHSRVIKKDFSSNLYELLDGIILNKLKNYDLVNAMYGIRCLNKLGYNNTNNIKFILDQQKIDGSFGYFGPEFQVSGYLKTKDLHWDYDINAKHLIAQVGFNSVWTIAEFLNKDYILSKLFINWLKDDV